MYMFMYVVSHVVIYIWFYHPYASYMCNNIWSKGVGRLKFRQYGQMKSKARKNLGRVKSEKGEIRDGESQTGEAGVARKGREVAKHCVFRVLCGSGRCKRKVANAAGAENLGR